MYVLSTPDFLILKQGSAHFLRTPSRATRREDLENSKAFLTELVNEISEINPELVQELERIAKGILSIYKLWRHDVIPRI